MINIKISKFLFCLSLVLGSALAHDHAPPHDTETSNYNIGIKAFKSFGLFTPKFEYQQGNKYENRRFSYYKLGSSFKLFRGLKLSAYYSGYRGLRHQDDWILNSKGDWIWQETGNRLEHLLDIGVKYKYRRSELSPYLYGIKANYQFNNFNGQTILIVNPSVHYFSLSRGVPQWSYLAQLSIYTPINFENEVLYKKGLYFSTNKHIRDNLILSFFYRYLVETWVDSQDSIDRNEGSYIAHDVTNTFGVNAIIYL